MEKEAWIPVKVMNELYARSPVDNRVGAEATVMGRLRDAGQEEQQIRAEPAAVE